MRVFTFRWKRATFVPARKRKLGDAKANLVQLQIDALDESGRVHHFKRTFEEWIGVCTSRIEKVIESFETHFPGKSFRAVLLLPKCTKVLPYFEKRLHAGKRDSSPKPFYKIYTDAPVQEVGRFFEDRHKVAYYAAKDWIVRVSIDLCIRCETRAFYHRWYDVNEGGDLLETFSVCDSQLPPPWTVCAFDLETVPLDGGLRVPDGMHPDDRVVMISVVMWNSCNVSKWLYYLDPGSSVDYAPSDVQVIACQTERQLLRRFHVLIQQCHVLTGYNIGRFDVPCLFARLTWLGMNDVLAHYSSVKIGDSIVATFQDKLVVDLYNYFKTFSNYDLPGFKLDDVAKAKLEGEAKLPISSVGIHAYYLNAATPEIVSSKDAAACYEALKPRGVSENQFGTFATYLEYCMRDSELVHRLFEKETVLAFLVERGNFAGIDVGEALHFGHARILLSMFKIYGTLLKFFVNEDFLINDNDLRRYGYKDGEKYQGALNYVEAQKLYRDISVWDFKSMYPLTLLSSNLCYGTCAILNRDQLHAHREVLASGYAVIPYRHHDSSDFKVDRTSVDERGRFRYPRFDPGDELAIVIDTKTRGFLPQIVRHFIRLREEHQRLWKATKDVRHYNQQLCIKILINSLYGVMANKDSCLGYLPIAMSIVTLARYQLLGSYHYTRRLGYDVCYADTDSLMVQGWPHDDCELINRFLDLPHVELKYEQRMKLLLVLCKKRYVYVTQAGVLCTKGFQKRINGLTKFLSDEIMAKTLGSITGRIEEDGIDLVSRGWITWVDSMVKAFYMCRDPKKYSITRKTKRLEEYKSKNCATYRMLLKNPSKENEFVEYTYNRADVAVKYMSQWIDDVEHVRLVDFQELFKSQKKIFVDLLNLAFWQSPDASKMCDYVLNTMRWKCFVHAELKHKHATGRSIVILVERGCRYTFQINDHLSGNSSRRVRKLVLE